MYRIWVHSQNRGTLDLVPTKKKYNNLDDLRYMRGWGDTHMSRCSTSSSANEVSGCVLSTAPSSSTQEGPSPDISHTLAHTRRFKKDVATY